MEIKLKNITKTYNGRKVLDCLDLTIMSGDFHVILGPSGEGKSTLLHLIAGLEKPDSGEIVFNDRPVTATTPQARAVGMVFQDYALFPHLDVYANVAYGLKASGMSKQHIHCKVKKYLSRMGMYIYKNQLPHQLSGGQKQRVALARCLVLDPEIILLDEPVSHIDAECKELLLKDLKEIHSEKKLTVLYVTHDKSEALHMAETISVMHHGKIEQVEKGSGLFSRPRTPFVAAFIGIKNIFNAQVLMVDVHAGQAELAVQAEEKQLLLLVENYPLYKEGKELQVCIHPEKILVSQACENGDGCPGVVKNIRKAEFVTELVIDLHGCLLKAIVKSQDFNRGDNVTVGFMKEAIHPLCGRKDKRPSGQRKCGA